MDSDILVKPQLRPCLVYATTSDSEPRRAFFHKWVTVMECGGRAYGYETEELRAIVEYENGRIDFANPRFIRFLDSGAMFYEQCWPDEEFY